ncbi:MAG: hypothetical protein COA58_14375 [Bacteroidetes bacterium]|nr:MAG: hypothetical protein COA58_14375 [Bacteroidota bacterium]
MLSLILWYFISKEFIRLAEKYRRKKPWKSAVTGLLFYLIGMVIGVFVIFLVGVVFFDLSLDNALSYLLVLLGIPTGLLSSYGYYRYLKRKYAREFVDLEADLNTIGQDSKDTVDTN